MLGWIQAAMQQNTIKVDANYIGKTAPKKISRAKVEKWKYLQKCLSVVIWRLFKMGWNFIVQISGLGGSRICFVIEEVTSLQSQSENKAFTLLEFSATVHSGHLWG